MAVARSAHIRSWRGAAAAVLCAGPMEATFVPEVGMLGVSLRHEGDELVALPHGLRGYRAGHQTGIPLLAPWANRLRSHHYEVGDVSVDLEGLGVGTDPNNLPMHGTMTAQPAWEVTELGAGVLRTTFRYGAHPDLLAAFPFLHDVELEASLSDRALTVTTTVRPTGDRAVPIAFGWHPYLRLPGSARRSWRLVLPTTHHQELDDRNLPTGREKSEPAADGPLGDRSFDDLYRLGDDRVLAVESRRWRLAVQFGEGYPFAQVYTPAGSGFVCMEPMTGPIAALSQGTSPMVEPGGEFSARFSVDVTRRS